MFSRVGFLSRCEWLGSLGIIAIASGFILQKAKEKREYRKYIEKIKKERINSH